MPGYDERLSRHLIVADVDGNGTKEIIAAYGDLVHVLREDGTELAGWPVRLSRPDGSPVFVRSSPAVGDLDGDGLAEIVVAEGNVSAEPPVEQTHVFRADGTELEGWPQVIVGCWDRSCEPGEAGEPPRGIAIADVDGDGAGELVMVAGPMLEVRAASGALLPGWPQTFPQGTTVRCDIGAECMDSVVAAGDVDRDGRAEIAAVATDETGRRRSHVLLYRGDGQLLPGFPRRIPGQRYVRSGGWTVSTVYNAVHAEPILADIDGDGDLEVVVPTTRGRLFALHHDGRRARLRPRAPKATRKCWGGHTVAMRGWIEPPVAGDLDGDGASEVVAGVARGRWKYTRRRWHLCLGLYTGPDYLHVASGARGWGAGGLSGWPVAFDYQGADLTAGVATPAIADVDGDLQPEVVVGRGVCESRGMTLETYDLARLRCFTVYALDRAGNPLPGFPKATLGPAANQSISPAIADLDGDGLKEIVWVDIWGRMMVWTVPGLPSPELGPWPMYRQNPALTGALE